MSRVWQVRFAWVGLGVFALVALYTILGPRLFTPTVGDDWTHQQLASHLRKKGIPVEVNQVNDKSAIFTDPTTGARVAVVRSPDAQTARQAASIAGWEWADSVTVGPFFIGAASSEKDVELLARVRRAVK